MTDLELEQSQLIEKLKLEIQEIKEKLKKYTNKKYQYLVKGVKWYSA